MIADDAAEPLEAVPVETRSDNPLTTALAWIGLALVVFTVGWWVWTRWIDPSAGGTIARYVNDGGVLYENPTDEFRVTTPTKGIRTTATNEFGTIVTLSSKPGDGYEFTVTKTPQSEDSLANYTSTLNQIARQMASRTGAEIVSQEPPVPIQDVAVKTIAYRKGDTYWRVQLLLLKDRLYTLVAKAPNDDEAPSDRLETSFQILGPR